MSSNERQPRDRDSRTTSSRRARANWFLLGAMAVLTLAAMAIGLDILLRPSSESKAARQGALAAVSTPATVSPGTPDQAGADTMPGAPPIQTALTPGACTAPRDWGLHVVEAGDTLFSLAQQYGTDVGSLQSTNCLEAETIFVGQQLRVPGGTRLPEDQPTASPGQPTTSTPAGASDSVSSIPSEPIEEPVALKISMPDTYLNILLLGIDRRPDTPKKVTWRADSIIVVTVDTERKYVRLLHVPRDLWAYIPGRGYDRINSGYLWGNVAEPGTGGQFMKQVVYYNLGIPIHYYAEVDFQGFINIIDALGGLDIHVDCPIPEMELEPGLYHMDGSQTIRYATMRHSSSDFDRGLRQRKVLMALWEQALTRDIIVKIPQLWAALSDNLRTDMPLGQVTSLASLGLQLSHNQIRQKAIGPWYVADWITPQGAWVLLPRQESIRELLEEYYAPQDLVLESKVRVQILNGSPRADAEQLAKDALQWQGFRVPQTGLAGCQEHEQSQILVLRGDPQEGLRVAQVLNLSTGTVQDLTTIPEPPDPANRNDIRVILGQDYDPCGR
jgi:polyisoprenyl-teichoic acid--peptidoglycan teichoic acid transferase